MMGGACWVLEQCWWCWMQCWFRVGCRQDAVQFLMLAGFMAGLAGILHRSDHFRPFQPTIHPSLRFVGCSSTPFTARPPYRCTRFPYHAAYNNIPATCRIFILVCGLRSAWDGSSFHRTTVRFRARAFYARVRARCLPPRTAVRVPRACHMLRWRTRVYLLYWRRLAVARTRNALRARTRAPAFVHTICNTYLHTTSTSLISPFPSPTFYLPYYHRHCYTFSPTLRHLPGCSHARIARFAAARTFCAYSLLLYTAAYMLRFLPLPPPHTDAFLTTSLYLLP